MENLDLLKSLIKKYGAINSKPTGGDLHDIVMNEYCKREPLTNEEKHYISGLAWQMINNFYGVQSKANDVDLQ